MTKVEMEWHTRHDEAFYSCPKEFRRLFDFWGGPHYCNDEELVRLKAWWTDKAFEPTALRID